ncbi:iron-containing alcohol dehydrogenase [Oceanobacillus rekensis]|uniref:iron-containing alcohol dehydrogenase n=1 Tax=Oceanobacillus rekensis TaxID=937927 RepID=UPI000B4526FB|nr:iron-containing alcohol dehydrogenase [Oceanobacillus rekensis]
MGIYGKKFHTVFNTNVTFGVDSVKENLVTTIKDYNKSQVFLVTDPGLVKAGVVDKITSLLGENSVNYTVFSEVEANPRAETVMEGAKKFKKEESDLILAVGGGSAIDFGKAVGVMISHEGHILDYRRGEKELTNETPTLFAIPTTVGTGTEVTAISVVTDDVRGRKYVISSPLLTPDIAFVDPMLTSSLPRHIVSTTAIDALVHAIEAYVSMKSNPFSDGLALQAIRMIEKSLPASYAQPEDMEARSQLHLASTIAGLAFGTGGLGMVHSCSHPMSAVHDVPHGLANAVILPHVVEHNLISNHQKYADIARIFDDSLYAISDKKAAEMLVNILKEFIADLDIATDFSYLKLEFTEEMVDRLSEDAMNDIGTIPNNPRKAVKEDIKEIYKKVLPLSNEE